MSSLVIEQGTPAWFASRCGKVTASRIEAVMAKGKNGAPSVTRANYEAQLIAERLTGNVEESFQSREMLRGKEVEPEARSNYAFMFNAELSPVGFVDHPRIAMSGASPDSFVGDDGLLELKCPNTATHLDTLLGKSIDGGYMKQMQWQMACTGRRWVDFCSYDNRLPAHLQLCRRRIARDDAFIAEMEDAVIAFIRGIELKIEELETLAPKAVAA